MKIYEATYYLTKPGSNEVKRGITVMFYANSKEQAKTLATAYMADVNDMNKVEVTETKNMFYLGLMDMYIKEHHGEERLLKEEVDCINRRRRYFGLDLLTL